MPRRTDGDFISQIELVVGLIILSVIVMLVFTASLMRFFGHPLIWSVDLAQLLFIWLCFLGADRALRMKGHMGVDLLIRRLSNRKRLYIESALALGTLVFLSSLIVKGIQLTIINKERLYGDSGIPYYFVTIAVPFGCLILGITVLRNFIFAWRHRTSGRELIFSRSGSKPSIKSKVKTEPGIQAQELSIESPVSTSRLGLRGGFETASKSDTFEAEVNE